MSMFLLLQLLRSSMPVPLCSTTVGQAEQPCQKFSTGVLLGMMLVSKPPDIANEADNIYMSGCSHQGHCKGHACTQPFKLLT